MPKIDGNKVLWRKVDDQMVLLHMETGLSYSLHGAACLIWNEVVAGKSSEEIAEGLTESYEVDALTAKEDAEALLKNLQKEGLIDL